MLIGLSSPITTRQPASRNAWIGCSRIDGAAPVRTFEVGQTSIATPSRAAQASAAVSSAMCDPCPIRVTPSISTASRAALAGPASAAWAVSPRPAAAAIRYGSRYGSSDG